MLATEISDVTVYLALYGLVISTPLDDIVNDLAGYSVDLAEARHCCVTRRPATHHAGTAAARQ
jgi:hypothetical protein